MTAIGSCRVLAPLRAARAIAPFRLNQTGIYGYCHASAEAVQQTRHLLANTRPPDDILPMVAPALVGKPAKAVRTTRADLTFVELCSAKIIRLGENCVQLNYLTRHFEDFFADRNRVRAFWQLAAEPDTTDRDIAAQFKNDPAFAQLPVAAREQLASVRLSRTTPEGLDRDIAWLREQLGTVVFVTHFNATRRDGALLRDRAAYISMARAALERAGALYYDPSDEVARFGQDRALHDPESSLSHYAPVFETHLARLWTRRFIRPLTGAGAKAATTAAAADTNEIETAQPRKKEARS